MGCLHAGVAPRGASFLSAGETAAGVTWTVASFAPGSVTVRGTRVHGNSAQRAPMDLLNLFIFNVASVQWWVRHGFAEHLEAEISIGGNAIAASARSPLVERGERSLSVVGTAAWRPWMSRRTPWFALGIDVTADWLVGGVHVSYGPEAHAFNVPGLRCQSFGQPGCGEFGPSAHFRGNRYELRLHMPLGISTGGSAAKIKDLGIVTFGVTPYWILIGHEAPRTLDSSATVDSSDFYERWGIHLLTELQFPHKH